MTLPGIPRLMFAVVTIVALVLTVLSSPVVAAPPPERPKGQKAPQVKSLSRVQGPLAPHVVTIRGKGFSKVRTVTFGKKKASRVRVVSPRLIKVTTPRVNKAATVPVRVRAKRGSSTAKSRYRFVGAPVVTSLSVSRGPLTGGTSVIVRGRDLDGAREVLFGALPAASIEGLSPRALRVTTPVSYAQDAPVVVRTRQGESAVTSRSRFAFDEPDPISTGSIEASQGVVVLDTTEVSAVARTGATEGWGLSLTGGAEQLVPGDGVVLEPGSPVFPPGLVGRVTSVQGPAGGARTVLVEPAAIADILDSAHVEFAGSIGDLTEGEEPVSPRQPGGRAERAVPSKLGFGSIGADSFDCTNGLGEETEISGKVTMELTQVNPYFRFDGGGLFSDPFVSAWVSYEKTVGIEVSGERKAECSLKASFQNTHKKVFVGPYGASFSFGPALSFSIGAKGTVRLSQHSYHMTGFISNPDGSIRELKGSSADPVSFGASASLGLTAYVGVEVQVGWLDRVGVGLFGGVSATAEVSVSGETSGTLKACGTLQVDLKATLYAYLDVFVKKWTVEGFELSVPLGLLERCWSVVPFGGKPEIVTTSFPEHAVGQGVYEELTTDDGRDGEWAVEAVAPATSALPPGLVLDGYAISGVATQAGTYRFRLVFTDENDSVVRADATMVVRTVASFESEVVTRVNELRDNWGCDPLTLNTTLRTTARSHSADMAANLYFSTVSLDGRDPGERMEDAGYDWYSWSENIGRGYADPGELYDGWYDYDPTFYAMVDCALQEVGMGLAFSSGGTSYWTMDMGEPYWRRTVDSTPAAEASGVRREPLMGQSTGQPASASHAGGR